MRREPVFFQAQLHLVSSAHSNFAPFFLGLPLRGRFLGWPGNWGESGRADRRGPPRTLGGAQAGVDVLLHHGGPHPTPQKERRWVGRGRAGHSHRHGVPTAPAPGTQGTGWAPLRAPSAGAGTAWGPGVPVRKLFHSQRGKEGPRHTRKLKALLPTHRLRRTRAPKCQALPVLSWSRARPAGRDPACRRPALVCSLES